MNSTQKQAFHDIVASVLGLSKSSVITANQNAPRPTKTYCTLRYYSHSQEVPSEQRKTATAGEELVISPTNLRCEVQMFATTGTDACYELNKLVNAFDRQTIIDICNTNNFCIIDAEPVQDISALLDNTTWETRASVDINIRFNTEYTDNVGYVATVEIAGNTYNSATTTPTISITEGE